MHDPPAVDTSAESTLHRRARIHRLKLAVENHGSTSSFRAELDAAEKELTKRTGSAS